MYVPTRKRDKEGLAVCAELPLKDLYRRKGKGRRCCLGDRIYSIPCHLSILHQDDMKKIMNSSYS